jgi:hypothetical protein
VPAWRQVAGRHGLTEAEIDRMASAFEHEDSVAARELRRKSRWTGSHHIFTKEGIPEILNLQPEVSSAKAYQVRQVRDVILRYQLAGGGDGD